MTPETKDLIDLGFKALIAIAAIYSGWRSKKNATALEGVRKEVNGQSAKLLKVTGEAEHAKGVKEEFEREKALIYLTHHGFHVTMFSP